MTTTPARYSPGGDIYLELASKYGVAVADTVAAAAVSNDPAALTLALSNARTGKVSSDYDTRGTLGIFFDQITSDPLAAPLESANNHIANIVFGLFKNPFVLLLVLAVVAWKFDLFKKISK